MTITHNGMREFVFYAKKWEPEQFEELVKSVGVKDTNGHQLQFMMQEDKNWDTFRNYAHTK